MQFEKYFDLISVTSDELDSKDAAHSIISESIKRLNGKEPVAGLIYISIYLDSKVILDSIMERFPGLELIGCTHDGVFSREDSYDLDAVNLILFTSDIIHIKAGCIQALTQMENQKNIESEISRVRQLSEYDASLCILLVPSMIISGAEVLEKVKSCFLDNFPIVGGAAADDWNFKETFQFYKNTVVKDAAVFLIFSGPVKFGVGVKSGWVGKGEKGTITQSKGNIVYRIDDMTAIEYFRKFLGDDITPLGEYPLIVYEPNEKNPYLRAALSQNEEDGSLLFAGDVREGVKIQIGYASKEQVIEASKDSLEQAFESYTGDKPSGVICFSCSGRKQVLGMSTGEEFKLVMNIKPDISIGGLYGYGEIAPINMGGVSKFHNETFVTLLVGT